MEKLNIPDSLKDYVLRLSQKEDIIPTNFDDLNVIRKINTSFLDCHKYLPRLTPFKYITYEIIRKYYGLPKVPDELSNPIIKSIIDDVKFTEEEPQSEFFAVLKDLYEPINELKKYLEENKPYLVIKTYKEICHKLRFESLDGYSGIELQKELEKRYSYPVNANSLLKEMAKKDTHISLKDFSLKRTPGRGYYSTTCANLAKYLHGLVYDYYKKTGYIYYPINDDIALYKFGGVLIVGYDYLDDLDVYLNDYGSHYGLKDAKFYHTLHQNKALNIRVDDSKLRSLFDFGLTTIIAPNDHFEEALIRYMCQETGDVQGIKEVLKKLGMAEEYLKSNELLTNNYYTYIPNIRDIDKIKVKDLDEYSTLRKITSKTLPERDAYYKKLASYYKGKEKKELLSKPVEKEESYRLRRKRNPKAWWND